MLKVKIHGCGSIGNHLANASRSLGWSVDMCDIDPSALKRTKHDIYPSRYGEWDDQIGLYESESAPIGGYDLIIIGTPPDAHIPLAMDAIAEKPKAIIIEKPICGPDLDGAQKLLTEAKSQGAAVFTGYDHVVGKAAEIFADNLDKKSLGNLLTLDVEFREHWAGIFGAHPWLSGPHDTYLGYFKRGGGASGEHSHAANLWQHFANRAGKGRVAKVTSQMDFVKDGLLNYDRLCILTLETETGFIGRVVQDVITHPARKWARAQFHNGSVEWQCGSKPGVDSVSEFRVGGYSRKTEIQKTRPDDFIKELLHIENALKNTPSNSPISLECGLDTMMVIAAAHLSAIEQKTISIDWSKGYTPSALSA